MKESFLSGAHPFVKLVFLVFLMITTFFILSFLGVLLAIPLYHISLTDIFTVASRPPTAESISLLKYLQLIQSIALFVLPPIFFVLLSREKISRYFGFDRTVKGSLYMVVFFMAVALVPVNNFLSWWNQNLHLPQALSGLEQMLRTMESSAEELMKAFMKMPTFGAYLINLFIVAVLAAVGEEMTFRGVIQPLFIRWTRSPHAGIIITGAVFSFFHFQFFGFFPRWLLGILFGYLFYWSRTLWVPVAAHFFNNALAVTVYYYAGAAAVEKHYDHIGVAHAAEVEAAGQSVVSAQRPVLIAGIAVVILSMYIFYRNRVKSPGEITAGGGEAERTL
jgi:membrane protease YdiL (CAAX protease family)